jgi:hypothetical protein
MNEGMRVLDYGAGRGRNAAWLRSKGVEVYAYDPYHGTDKSGWSGVSDALPEGSFDLVFTNYVLCVVPKDVEDEVISDLRAFSPTCAHIVRGDELLDAIRKMYYDGNPYVQQSWNKFRGDVLQHDLEDFCRRGVHTGSDKYQRLSRPDLPLVHETQAWKVYVDGG